MTMSSDFHDVGVGRFSCKLCAPYRPPRLPNASIDGIGSVLIEIGCVSQRASSTHASFGQSPAPSTTDSSVMTSKLRLNNGSMVCAKPKYGGQLLHRDTTFGRALSLISRITAP